MNNDPPAVSDVLRAEHLTVRYRGMMRPALNSVSLQVQAGVTLGVVGESGSGKSTLGRCLVGMERPAAGSVYFRDRDIAGLSGAERRMFRRKVQMIFQDPFNSLNSRFTIGSALREVLVVHRLSTRDSVDADVRRLLDQVGLGPSLASRYPHELSGGQRQRVGIARALACKPAVIIADEPVSALDVSVQAHILNLLKELAVSNAFTLVLIAHDLAVVGYCCQRIAVMNQGLVVEQGIAAEVLNQPQHAYTKALLASVPHLEVRP